MKYDDASWHFGGNFPDGQPIEHGGTHIGLFLRWCFMKGWAGELHTDEKPEAVRAVIAGEMTGTEFLFKYCDGKFTNEDLNTEGNEFTERYYREQGYLKDYAAHFGEQMYLAPERAHDFEGFSEILEGRLKVSSLRLQEMKPKPWWKLW